MLRNQRVVRLRAQLRRPVASHARPRPGFKPDAELFPEWSDSELQGDIRNQPVLFFREILANDLSVLNLLDSKWTIATRKLQKVLYKTAIKPARPNNQEQPQRIELPEGQRSRRSAGHGGGAGRVVASAPDQPGAARQVVLDAILGTPPPPPPPNVPPLEEAKTGAAPATSARAAGAAPREPGCASCHSRIDPLGFALENYDVLGRWRDEEAGKPVDAKGELPDGTKFEGPRRA